MSSSFHKQTFDEKWHAESYWIRQRARNTSDPEAILQRGDADLERLIQIDNAIKGFFASIGGALDALGTTFVGIGAINFPITEAAWSTVAKSHRWLGQPSKALEPPKTSGREAQEKFIKTLLKAVPTAPAKWLEWSLDMRNALIHRGVRMSPTQVWHQNRTGLHVALLLPLDPKFTDAEAYARAKDYSEIYLREPAEVTLNTVFENMQTLTSNFLAIFSKLWHERVADPTLIVQPGNQWESLWLTEPTGFKGTGTTLPSFDGHVRISSSDAKRWLAAKVLDADNEIWKEIQNP